MSAPLDVSYFSPSNTAVRNAIKRIASTKRESFRVYKRESFCVHKRESFRVHELDGIMALGGGVSCDGLKNEDTSTNYYDLTAHYFSLGTPDFDKTEKMQAEEAKHIFN
ncbi:hypothetical protein FGB62_41g21 [Gracilaria domingensis]|nr:hypothetical protein FGB62_41g21 [Gracilaria domingensis]